MSYETDAIIKEIRAGLDKLEVAIDQKEQDLKDVEKNYDDLKDELHYIEEINKAEMEKADEKVLSI